MEPNSIDPTLFEVKLFKVKVPLIENSFTPINLDFVDRSWINVVERIYQDRCSKVKKRNKEAKVNWLKEGF